MEFEQEDHTALTKRNWVAFLVIMGLISPLIGVVVYMVTWPAILDARAGHLLDWETPLALTVVFVFVPVLSMFSFLVRTRFQVSSDGIHQHGLICSKTIKWVECPYIAKEDQDLIVRGPSERIVVPLSLFRDPDVLEEFVREKTRRANA